MFEIQGDRIRIKDIAEKAKVSVGTVDRVIHDRGEVAEETRKHVLAIIEDLSYTPNMLAKSLALKKQYLIAALIPAHKQDNPYWKMPMLGIEKAYREIQNFNTAVRLFTFDLNSERSFAVSCNEILETEPDGIVFSPLFYESSKHFINACDEKNIPYVFIDANIEGCNNMAYFGQNTFQSGYLAAKLMDYGIHEQAEVLVVNLMHGKGLTHHLKTREKGFLSYFSGSGATEKITVSSYDIRMDEEGDLKCKMDMAFRNGRSVRGIFVTSSRVYRIANYLDDNKLEGILLAGYDLIDKNLGYLEKGTIDYLIGQKPEEQGYKSIQAMFNHFLRNREVERTNYSPIDIIVKENIDYYKNFML
ncbi:MAG: substrate-binding domain-containing protein [Bacteroidales bacterium]|jgi:LacI family transcriptional regulator